ncbi:hypothetical protein [uncultured phage]|nr:hypothetical protein [uncultured phage]
MWNSVLHALNGTKIINDTTEVTQGFDAILVLQDTVFTSIKVAGVDVKSTYITTPATAVKAGAIIRPTSGTRFSGVKLTSGSIEIVL